MSWVARYISALDNEDTKTASQILAKAWESTQGITQEWSLAWQASAQQGFAEGVEQLMTWGIPMPRIKGKTLRERLVLAIHEERGIDRSPFRKSDGTLFKGLCAKEPNRLVQAVLGPGSPPLSLQEAKTLIKCEQWDWIAVTLNRGGLRPWGGAQACALAADLLLEITLVHDYVKVRHQVLDALENNLPEGMASQTGRHVLLEASTAQIQRRVTQARCLSERDGEGFRRLLGFFDKVGVSSQELCEAMRKGKGETLSIVSIRLNVPEGMVREMEERTPWSGVAKEGGWGSASNTRFAAGASIFTVLKQRLQTRAPGLERWWDLCSQVLLQHVEFETYLRQPQNQALKGDEGINERWAALVKQACLAKAWRKAPVAELSTDPEPAVKVRRARL